MHNNRPGKRWQTSMTPCARSEWVYMRKVNADTHMQILGIQNQRSVTCRTRRKGVNGDIRSQRSTLYFTSIGLNSVPSTIHGRCER